MIVEMDDESKKWLESRKNQLTVSTLEVDACCAPSVQQVIAVPGTPKTYGNYRTLTVDNVIIHVQKHLFSNQKLTLTLKGIGLFKSISVNLE